MAEKKGGCGCGCIGVKQPGDKPAKDKQKDKQSN